LAARLKPWNKFTPSHRLSANAIAFLRRLDADSRQIADDGLLGADGVVYVIGGALATWTCVDRSGRFVQECRILRH
jgi:hypothetical protein